MELYEAKDPVEVMLKKKATAMKRPFGGAMELLPVCNMNCNMCYVRENRADILSAEEWLKIGESLRDAGVLMILLTGGEPLLHPGFREIYVALQRMGFILNVNTNGTLINEEWANLFYQNPCRRINVTLYGASEETYGRLCHYPDGFEKTVNALRLLKSREIPCRVNIDVVRENRDDLTAMMELVRSIGLEFVYTTYVFPPVRGGNAETFVRSRMSPREAAALNVERTFQASPNTDRAKQAKAILKALTDEKKPIPYEKGLSCTAGKSGFWIDWEGKLCTCGMLPEPSFSLKEYTFEEAWGKLVPRVSEFETSKECHNCRKKFLCPVCAAGMYTETGDMKNASPYLCEMTDEMVKIMFGYLDDGEKDQTREALKACGLIYDF